MMINCLRIGWQIKYFLNKFYLEIFRWSFEEISWLKINNSDSMFVKTISWIVLQFWAQTIRFSYRYLGQYVIYTIDDL